MYGMWTRMVSFTMLRYFENSTAKVAKASGFERILVLHDKVEAIRCNEEIGVKFMNEWEEKMIDRQATFEEGEASGFKAGKLDTARNMLRKGIDKQDILDMTGLTIEEIETLL